MAKESILIVEDDADIREMLRHTLAREGYAVHAAASGEEGLQAVQSALPDAVLLDLMLPGMDGLEVCRRLRTDPAAQGLAILMVTAKGDESDIVAGLELGADDYVVKPFSPKVLIARVRAVLRRKQQHPPDADSTLQVHGIVIHPGRHEVTVDGEAVELTATEFRLLHLLARRPGWVFTRYQIVNAVRGADCAVTDRAVDVQMVGLRRKLGSAGACIETVRGVGYRFKE